MKVQRFSKFMSKLLLLPAFLFLTGVTSCSDDVDESNLYSFTGDVITSYLQSHQEFSKFCYLLDRVRFSPKSSSTISDLLAARGNYTCFVPTDEALQQHLDSIYHTTDYDIHLLPDSVAEDITRSCIIDNQDQDGYKTTVFQEGTLERPTMGDRFITIRFTVENGKTTTIVNNQSRITTADIELENGVIHVVDRVLTFSNSTLPDLIGSTENLQIFAHLLEETGWDKQMLEFRDMDYEMNHEETGLNCSTQGTPIVDCPPHRDFGYTAFVETDSVYAVNWNLNIVKSEEGLITNWDDIMAKAEAMCRQYYPNATSNDLKSQDNAINQFVSYHLLGRRVTFDKMVIHYNEIGIAYTRPENLSINAWEYYETIGKQRRMLKVTEGRTTNGKRINRYVAKYNLENYEEIDVPRPGILVKNRNNGLNNNALNGYYYTLDEMLVYDPDVPSKVLNERMRHDIVALIPEITTNGLRRLSVFKDYHIPNDYSPYFYASDESNIAYLSGYGATSWKVYQGDEINIEGQYDVYMRLPPVPYAGTYELRQGISMNSRRGMCQIYFGTNPQNLAAVGLPIDLRLSADDPGMAWQADDPEDELVNVGIDKTMRNNGFMKGPEYFGLCSSTGTTESVRNMSSLGGPFIRRILWTGHMEPEQVYWVRYKSVLESTQTQLDMDMIEIVPKSVYNGSEPEDRW